ncbi:KPN_02809 family neutral zinc metallopeptidase [Falsiroseomonas ponticola]|uniref:KPN_02809 family neutral zinc metallopeptidase n=1 Tax=Falsiroseomonas ponticola TaxID=2786951 RepID=UPI001931D394|nr:neutral zinc metallopeptidase [Roseomonas ponticola]
MQLGDGRESSNVEDRRGGGGFGGRGIAVGGGLGSVVLVVLALLFGVDPGVILSGGDPAPARTETQGGGAPPADDAGSRFVRRVLAETEDVWNPVFQQMNRRYQEPRLVLFSGAVQSACGMAQAAVGPFYCPGDQRVYIDLDFLAQMQRQLGAPGDFAAAYVIAHEVGHHVQNQLGVLGRVQELRGRASEAEGNALQVRVELQADCLAGMWARRAQDARQILEDGDIEEGLNAAAAVGDDRLQRRARGQVQPDSFTHGSSEQRVRWFRTGLQSGQLEACDTFRPARP